MASANSPISTEKNRGGLTAFPSNPKAIDKRSFCAELGIYATALLLSPPSLIKTETTLRVRYGETDQMGFVYYGVYAQYYEVGRVEAMRSLGFSYREMEESGVLMPVINLTVNYKKPAKYEYQ